LTACGVWGGAGSAGLAAFVGIAFGNPSWPFFVGDLVFVVVFFD